MHVISKYFSMLSGAMGKERAKRPSKFSELIKISREKKGLSQEDIETLTRNYPKDCRMSKGYVAQVEMGQVYTPSWKKVFVLMKLLGISIEALWVALGLGDLEAAIGEKRSLIGRRPYDQVWRNKEPGEKEIRFIKMAVVVLRSEDKITRGALEQNIVAFDRSIGLQNLGRE